MSESLRNDGRVWVPEDGRRHRRSIPSRSPTPIATITSSASTRASATCPRATSPVARREGSLRRGPRRRARRAGRLSRLPRRDQARRRGPHPREVRQPVRHVRADHRRGSVQACRCGSIPRSTTRWAGCGSTTTCRRRSPACSCLGEANFSDHGANRLGASALMQGLADGYFIIPYTLGNYLAGVPATVGSPIRAARRSRPSRPRSRPSSTSCSSIRGKRSVDSFHKELGHIMWEDCGMARSKESLERALAKIPTLREEFWRTSRVLGRPTRSTSRSRRPAASPTSSSSAS